MVRYSGFGRDVFFLGRVYAQVKRVEPELIELGIVPEISEEREVGGQAVLGRQ